MVLCASSGSICGHAGLAFSLWLGDATSCTLSLEKGMQLGGLCGWVGLLAMFRSQVGPLVGPCSHSGLAAFQAVFSGRVIPLVIFHSW